MVATYRYDTLATTVLLRAPGSLPLGQARLLLYTVPERAGMLRTDRAVTTCRHPVPRGARVQLTDNF